MAEFSLPFKNFKTRDLTDPILDTASGQVKRLMACDTIKAKIMKYDTLSCMSVANLAKLLQRLSKRTENSS